MTAGYEAQRTMPEIAPPHTAAPSLDRPPEPEKTNYSKALRDFVVENFLFGEEGKLTDDTSFLEEGIIDSTGILELVNFLEETFQIVVDDDDIVPENFDSLNNILNYLVRKDAGRMARA